jgi:hypothetical protein
MQHGAARTVLRRAATRTYCTLTVCCLYRGRCRVPQGIVYETLDLSGLPDYSTGGTIHMVVNNQVRTSEV